MTNSRKYLTFIPINYYFMFRYLKLLSFGLRKVANPLDRNVPPDALIRGPEDLRDGDVGEVGGGDVSGVAVLPGDVALYTVYQVEVVSVVTLQSPQTPSLPSRG